jgi:hypothetical protein
MQRCLHLPDCRQEFLDQSPAGICAPGTCGRSFEERDAGFVLKVPYTPTYSRNTRVNAVAAEEKLICSAAARTNLRGLMS